MTEGPICTTCNDTHRMPAPEDSGSDVWMCTSCPTPCQKCRAGGNGPFCEKTPCECECHADHFRYKELRAEAVPSASPIRPVGLHPFEAGEGGDPRTEACTHSQFARCSECTVGDGSALVIATARMVRDSLRPNLSEEERHAAWNLLDDALIEYDRRARRAAQRH